MAAIVMETGGGRRPYFSAIRWTAILGGLVAGLGTYMLLALLGLATGLTVAEPGSTASSAGVPIGMGIGTGLITLVTAFIGAYIAARMSGLSRSSDGMLHGFMTWAATMVLFAFLATTAISSILGGTFSMLGQGLQGAGTAASSAQGSSPLGDELRRMMTGSANASLDAEDANLVWQRLQSGDRQGAIDHMVNQMGFSEQRATQLAETLGSVSMEQLGEQARQSADSAVTALAAASWWLFIGLALSLLVALIGGTLGARAYADRTVGDHVGERRSIRI